MKELIRMMATCRKFRQVQVVRNFRTTQKIVYAVRTQLRCIPRILNPSNSMGLGNKLITK
jgi:hypothetical protein